MPVFFEQKGFENSYAAPTCKGNSVDITVGMADIGAIEDGAEIRVVCLQLTIHGLGRLLLAADEVRELANTEPFIALAADDSTPESQKKKMANIEAIKAKAAKAVKPDTRHDN